MVLSTQRYGKLASALQGSCRQKCLEPSCASARNSTKAQTVQGPEMQGTAALCCVQNTRVNKSHSDRNSRCATAAKRPCIDPPMKCLMAPNHLNHVASEQQNHGRTTLHSAANRAANMTDSYFIHSQEPKPHTHPAAAISVYARLQSSCAECSLCVCACNVLEPSEHRRIVHQPHACVRAAAKDTLRSAHTLNTAHSARPGRH